MYSIRILLVAIFVQSAAASLHAQSDPGDRADSIMRNRDDLFDVQLDTTGESSIPPARPLPPARWTPEFQARFGRRDLLGLRDRPFFITYDRADGLNLTAGTDLPMSFFSDARLQGYASIGYAFGSHYWQIAGGLRRDFLSDELPLRMGIEGHLFTDTRDAWKMDPIENTLFALIAGGDARDYFKRGGFSASIEQFVQPRTSIAIAFQRDLYRRSEREVGWSIFGPEQPFRDVQPVREGILQSVTATIEADYATLRSWTEPQIGFAVQAEFGTSVDRNAPPTSSDPDWSFQTYTVDARAKAIIIDQLLGLAVHARAGASTGNAPPQRMFSIGGVGTVPGYPQNEYSGDRLFMIQSDLLVQPVRRGFLRNVRIIVSNDIAVVALADQTQRNDPFSIVEVPINEWKYSPGVYIGTPAARFRIGIAWRTDIAATPRFVLRLSEVF